ncbi:MAG: TonB-dependent receptor [Fibrobacteres bacterium]|nr:TonB-dependent receptor [Fibrobacterota bacterium]
MKTISLVFILLFTTFARADEYELNTAPVDTIFIDDNGDTVKSSELDSLQRAFAIVKLPTLKQFVKAEYPPEAMKSGREGEILFDLFVSDSGLIDSLKILKGAYPDLDTAAIKAVSMFRFVPAVAGGGQTVPVIVEYVYRFSIAEEIKDVEEFVNLSGALLEKGTRIPIPDAPVILTFLTPGKDTTIKVPWEAYIKKISSFSGQKLEGDRLTVVTDKNGKFSFKSLPTGTVRLSFLISGYKADSVDESVTRAVFQESEYRIEPLVTDEYEIVVYGRIEKKEVAKSSLSLTEVKRIPGFGGDAVKVVQALPGVARASFGSGEIIVRGSGEGDTRYFLDGIEIPLLFHFGGLRSTYNSDALSSVDLYPGGFNARYGGSVGGVVEIKGRSPALDRIKGNLDINLIDASFLVEGPLNNIDKNLSLLLTARRSYIANVATWFIEKAGIKLPLTVVPYYWDGVARLEYKFSNTSKLFVTGFFGADMFKFITTAVRGGSSDISSEQNVLSQEIKFNKGIIGFDYDISDNLKNELRFAAQNTSTLFNVFSFFRIDLQMNGFYVRDELTHKLDDNISARYGIDMQADSVTYEIAALTNSGASLGKQRSLYTDLGLYAAIDYRPLKGLLLTPGVRYDYFNELSESHPAFRFTGRYEWKKGHAVKGAFGTYSQSPEPMGQALDTLWGNPELPATLATHYVAGYEWQITDLISADLQTYYNSQGQIPMRYSDTAGPPSLLSPDFMADQKGRMYGLELMLRHNQGKRFFGWLSYSLSKSERNSERSPQIQGGGNSILNVIKPHDPSTWYPFEKDQTHNLQIVGSWKLPKGWEAGFKFRYTTGNPATPLLGYTDKKYEFDDEIGGYNTLYGEYFSDRMEPFFQLDVRVDKKWLFDKWNLSTYLDIQNLNYFWYNSPETYSYNFDDSERSVVGGIIIPSLGIRAEF